MIFFVTPQINFADLAEQISNAFPDTKVIGCTTAGEISEVGYTEREVVVVGFLQSHFSVNRLLIPDLSQYNSQHLVDQMIRNRNELQTNNPAWFSEFNFLLVDGLSMREDALVSALAPGQGSVPLFGGSAGDATNYQQTLIFYDGKLYQNAAVLTQFITDCPVKVIKSDHFIPSEQRMVVTRADPARRIVSEINAEPAAREYARLLGKDPSRLSSSTFAAHPVVVRLGGQHHVRAIQRIDDEGNLWFSSAIDEGLVLTLANATDIVAHLETELSHLAKHISPIGILACDCFTRRIESQQKGVTEKVSQLLSQHHVVGFSTYGEQFNSTHINQTLTAVAIYPPGCQP